MTDSRTLLDEARKELARFPAVLDALVSGLTAGRWHMGNFRTHRKIAIFDGIVGFLGGINLHEPAAASDVHDAFVGQVLAEAASAAAVAAASQSYAVLLDAPQAGQITGARCGDDLAVPFELHELRPVHRDSR